MIAFLNVQGLFFHDSGRNGLRCTPTGAARPSAKKTAPFFEKASGVRHQASGFYSRARAVLKSAVPMAREALDEPCPERTNGYCADRCYSVLNSDTAERRGLFTEGLARLSPQSRNARHAAVTALPGATDRRDRMTGFCGLRPADANAGGSDDKAGASPAGRAFFRVFPVCRRESGRCVKSESIGAHRPDVFFTVCVFAVSAVWALVIWRAGTGGWPW